MGDVDVTGALRRYWIAGATVLAITIIVTIAATARQTPMYEAAAQLVVAPAPATSDTADVIRSLESLERRTVVATFARMAATDETREAAATQLRLDPKSARRFRTRGSVVPNTNIIRIDTRGPDPARAAAVANATAGVIARDAQSLYRVYVLRPLSRATPPSRPAYPDPQRNLIVGVAVGTALAFAIMLALARLRRPRA